MAITHKITPNLWFDTQAEEAARFYTAIFPDSTVGRVTHYGSAGKEIHGFDAGDVLTVEFTLSGQPFVALNGGPAFQFNEAVSFIVTCESQQEKDYYWEKLSAGGDPAAQQCGWLKDRFGVSWQVGHAEITEMINTPDAEQANRVMEALLKMKKLDVEILRQAYQGG